MKEFISNKNYHVYDEQGENLHSTYAPVAIVSLSGSEYLCKKINSVLFNRRMKTFEKNPNLSVHDSGFLRQDYCVQTKCIRFSSGEAKVVLDGSVRGHDLYFICDVTNHSIEYKMFNQKVPMGPDDHFQDLKRAILATCGRARRISVIMPYLYESRQDIRRSRESLDCAMMIKELFSLGVSTIITFDPHEPRVENANPLKSLDIIPATFQLISAFLKDQPNISLDRNNGLMIISQDETSMKRGMYYASTLEVPLGTFYRQRDYSTLIDGRNPIIDYNYLGDSVEGRDVVIVDDMFVSGNSFIQTAKMLKERKAKNVYGIATFGMFSQGLDVYQKAYEEGIFDKIYITNLNYLSPELNNKNWCHIVDMSELLAYLIDALNFNVSVASLLDHTSAIKSLLSERKCPTDRGTYDK